MGVERGDGVGRCEMKFRGGGAEGANAMIHVDVELEDDG